MMRAWSTINVCSEDKAATVLEKLVKVVRIRWNRWWSLVKWARRSGTVRLKWWLNNYF